MNLAQAAPTRPIDAGGLGQGPCGRMQMKLEKTWLDIDVLRLEIRFDAATGVQLCRLTRGRPVTRPTADRIVGTALEARHVFVQLEFLRDVSLDRFLAEMRTSLSHAVAAGMISRRTVEDSILRVRQSFASLADRGFEDGDRIRYLVTPGRGGRDSLRAVVVDEHDRVLVDVSVEDPHARRALLAGYFAPGSDFREDLIRSLR